MTNTPARVISLGASQTPRVSESAFLATGAVVVGDVTVSDHASVWYNAVVRADAAPITLGDGSNIQDGCTLHADPGFPAVIGADVSVGHNAVIHGSTVEDGCLIGMGAVMLNGCHIGAGSMIAAGTVLLENTDIPPGSLVAGVPGKVRRALTDAEIDGLRGNAGIYRELSELHRAANEALQ